MIRYTCENCKEKLESPDTLAGLQDQCPTCGQTVTVPQESSARRIKPFWLGAILGFVSATILAVVIVFATYPTAQTPKSEPTVPGKPIASRKPVEEIEKLTLDDILAFGKAHGMEMPRPFMGTEPDSCDWILKNGVFFRCVLRPEDGNRIKSIYISNTGEDHGPKAQTPVLSVWAELSPDMASRFKTEFTGDIPRGSQMLWIGKSAYAYGTNMNNKAFVEYIGPQSDIPRRKALMAVTARVRINWHRCLLTSREKLRKKLASATSEEESLKALSRAMMFLENEFENVYTSDFVSVESTLNRKLRTNPMLADSIPLELPIETRTELYKAASAIRTIAQLTRFIIAGKRSVPYRPYDIMIIALAKDQPENTAWGPYKRIDGLANRKQLPEELRKGLEKLVYGGISAITANCGIIKPQ